MQQIFYDLRNYAYIEAHLLGHDDEHARHMIADICEDGNIDRVKATLDIAHAEIPAHARHKKDLIHEYLVCRALADWLEIAHPPISTKWQEKAAQAYAALCQHCHRPLLRPMRPF